MSDMPDVIFMTDNETLWGAACRDVDKFHKYHHDRIVTELQSRITLLETFIETNGMEVPR